MVSSPYPDPHYAGSFRAGYSRAGVRQPVFDLLIARDGTVKVTLKKRVVSNISFDSVTGWPTVTWEESTIDAVIQTGPGALEQLGAGAVATLEGTIKSADPFRVYDRFEHKGATYVVATEPREFHGLDGGFIYRMAGFSKITVI